MTAQPECKRDKAVYHVKQIAESMAKRRASQHGYPIYVYECAECHGWHLTKHDPVKWRERQKLLAAAQAELTACAPKPSKPPGYWTAVQAAKPGQHKRTERANNLKRAMRKTEARFDIWSLCLRPSVNEAKFIAKLQAARVPRMIDHMRKVQQELAARTIEASRLRDLLRQVNSAWLDRGRYVKSDVIEEALREFRSREVS